MKNIFHRAGGNLPSSDKGSGQGEQSRRWKLFLWLLLPVALVVILLTVVLQDIVHHVILVPVAYVFWLGGQLLNSTPDILLWGWLILMAIILAVRSFNTGKDLRSRPVDPKIYRSRRDRQAFWLLQIQLAESPYARMRFVDFLSKVTIHVLSFRERMQPLDVEQNLEIGDLVIPPEVARFIQPKARPRVTHSKRLWMDFWGGVGRIFSSLTGKKARTDTFEHDLLRLVEFLEKQLYIDPDTSVPAGSGGYASLRDNQTQSDKD